VHYDIQTLSEHCTDCNAMMLQYIQTASEPLGACSSSTSISADVVHSPSWMSPMTIELAATLSAFRFLPAVKPSITAQCTTPHCNTDRYDIPFLPICCRSSCCLVGVKRKKESAVIDWKRRILLGHKVIVIFDDLFGSNSEVSSGDLPSSGGGTHTWVNARREREREKGLNK
jgi:hypothetical protein